MHIHIVIQQIKASCFANYLKFIIHNNNIGINISHFSNSPTALRFRAIVQ